MKNFIVSVLSLSFLISCSSGVGGEDSIEPNNSIDEKWIKTFGGYEEGKSVQQTTDGGYVITGGVLGDVYIFKTDSSGNELWNQTFGGTENDQGNSIQQTTDGGYIITGSTKSFGNGYIDVYLIKTDESGNEQWSKTFGGQEYDVGESVQQTSDGGYIITGFTSSFGNQDVYLIKTDGNGNEQWSKTVNVGQDGWGYSIQQTTDGGYIITGQTVGNVFLMKTDEDGNEEWNQTFGGTEENDQGRSVQQTNDGGYVIIGSTFGNIFNTEYSESYIYLIKTDGNGNEQWSKLFEGTTGQSIQQTLDGGYILTGGSGFSDILLIKTDGNGNEQWSKTFGGYLDGESVQQTLDGGYVITGGYVINGGVSGGGFCLIKTDENGNVN